MADSNREMWSVPVSATFAEELRQAMAAEGYESRSEFVRAALREKLERIKRSRLEAELLEGLADAPAESIARWLELSRRAHGDDES